MLRCTKFSTSLEWFQGNRTKEGLLGVLAMQGSIPTATCIDVPESAIGPIFYFPVEDFYHLLNYYHVSTPYITRCSEE